jgi:hypothetical protein
MWRSNEYTLKVLIETSMGGRSRRVEAILRIASTRRERKRVYCRTRVTQCTTYESLHE